MSKVSIIIPVYNVEIYLRECMDSVINQTLKDIEIICVDDGSTDSCPAILDEYALKDKRIKVIHKENGGLGDARNVGMQYATGEYIYFLDSDDYIVTDAIEKLYNKSVKLDLDICVCLVKEIDTNTKKSKIVDAAVNKAYLPDKEIFSSYDVKDTIFHLFIGWVWDKMYKRSLIVTNNITFPKYKNTEDTAFTYFALILSNRISTLQECLIIHRTSVNTSMSVNRGNEPDAFIKAMDLLKNNLIEIGRFENFRNGFFNYFLTFSKWHLDTISENYREDLYKKIIEYLDKNLEENCNLTFLNNYVLSIYKYYKKCSNYSEFKSYEDKIRYTIFEKIFSIKNSQDKMHKILTILGIKLKLNRR